MYSEVKEEQRVRLSTFHGAHQFSQLAYAPEVEEQRSDDPLKIVEIQPAQDPGNMG